MVSGILPDLRLQVWAHPKHESPTPQPQTVQMPFSTLSAAEPAAVTEASRQRLHHQLQLGYLQGLPQSAVRALLLWVQVESGV